MEFQHLFTDDGSSGELFSGSPWYQAASQNEGNKGSTFTPVLVNIDPLGAVGDVPWSVHRTSFSVRSGPDTSFSLITTFTTGTMLTGDFYVVQETDQEWVQFEVTPGTMGWINSTGINRIHPTNTANISTFGDLPIGDEIVNRWWGIPMSYEPSDLMPVPLAYSDRSGSFLREDALNAAIAMIDASRLAGEEVLIASPYRSGPTQQTIYINSVNNNGLNQRSSAPPGHSEHQLGLTVDFDDADDNNFLRNTDSEYIWMVNNAPSFGWRQSYTASNTDETGYIEEPWHWRYIGLAAAEVDGWLFY